MVVIHIEHEEGAEKSHDGSSGRRRRQFRRRVDDATKDEALLELLIVKRKQTIARVWIAIWTLVLAGLMAVTGQIPALVEHFSDKFTTPGIPASAPEIRDRWQP